MPISDSSKSFTPKIIKSSTEPALTPHLLNVPIMNITTQGGAPVLTKTDYVVCTYNLTNTSTPYTGTGRIRGRGNSTWTQPKKPYKIKLDTKSSLLGMASSKDWALLANYFDPDNARNAIAMEISSRTTMAWTPHSKHVEVYLNGVYLGLYQLFESVVIATDRVNIKQMATTDTSGLAVTGGYLMEIDVRMEQNNDPGFRTTLNVPVAYDDPDGLTPAHATYIRNWMQNIEDILFGPNFTNPTTGYARFLDLNSWADWYLLCEVVGNNDSGFGASVKLYKPRDTATVPGKLYLGPSWDFDLSVGIGAFGQRNPQAWWTRNGASWIARMLEDPAFVSVLNTRWAAMKASLTGVNSIYDFIDRITTLVKPELVRDAPVWNNNTNGYAAGSAYMKNWFTTRIAWMDAELASSTDTTPPSVPTGLASANLGPFSVDLSWNASTDDVGVAGYKVWQNGVVSGLTAIPYSDSLTNLTIGHLAPNTNYTFAVQARDARPNWSALSSTINVTTPARAGSPNGLSVFLNASPGTLGFYTDGTPSIVAGNTFYTYGPTSIRTRQCVGARLWCPSGVTMPPTATIYAWYDNYDMSTTPLRQVTVNTVTGPAWVEVTWAPFDMTMSKATLIAVSYPDTPAGYLYYDPGTGGPIAPNIADSPGLYLSATAEPGFKRSYFRIGTDPTQPSVALYGVDILMSDPT